MVERLTELAIRGFWAKLRDEGFVVYDNAAVSFQQIMEATRGEGRREPRFFMILLNRSRRPSGGATVDDASASICSLCNCGDEVFAKYEHFRFVFQRTPYTPGGFVMFGAHRSSLEARDLETLLPLAHELRNTVFWVTSARAGATVDGHIHVQGHDPKHLGGQFPIARAPREEIYRVRSVRVWRIWDYPLPAMCVTWEEADHRLAARTLHSALAELHAPYNLVLPQPGEAIIVGRSKEIPKGWATKRWGSAEVAGVVITREPLPDLTFDTVCAALVDVGLSADEHGAWERRVIARLCDPRTRRELFDLRLIVLDIEGVLTPAKADSAWNLPGLERLRWQLERVQTPVILCSGRQTSFGEALIGLLNLRYALSGDVARQLAERFGPLKRWPCIFEGGCIFFDPVVRKAFPNPELAERSDALRVFNDVRRVAHEICKATGAAIEPGKEFALSLNPPFVGTDERLPIDEFEALVAERLAAYREVVEISRSASAVDITPRGVSKASAVRLLLDAAGLDPAEVLGVDDSAAGAAWLREVGWSATPRNGSASLNVDYRSHLEEVEGVVDIVPRFAWPGASADGGSAEMRRAGGPPILF